jgi:hypothetical protein
MAGMGRECRCLMAEADLGRTSDLDGREITGGCVLSGSPIGQVHNTNSDRRK